MVQFPNPEDTDPQPLLRFSTEVLQQALALVVAHEAPGAPVYAAPVGAHLRHVIEHYDALLFSPQPGVVDYDNRPRDRELESSTARAQARLTALLRQLAEAPAPRLGAVLQVRGQAGLGTGFGFVVGSTMGRELVFAASHAIHHYALLQAHCARHGIPISADFGHAPATLAHRREALSNPAAN